MLDYSIKLLNLFLFPFQEAFVDSILFSVSLIALVMGAIVFLVQLVKELV